MSLVSPKTNSLVDPDDYPHVYGYDGSNNLITDTFTDRSGTTYVKTFTYTGSNLTGASIWVHA